MVIGQAFSFAETRRQRHRTSIGNRKGRHSSLGRVRASKTFQANSSAWAVKHRYHSAVFCKTLRTCLWEILSPDSKLLLTCRIIFESFRLAWHEDGVRGEQGARIDRG